MDARVAVAQGADAIGINFYSLSARFVNTDDARQIAAAAGALVSVVGLFVDAEISAIRNTLGQVSLSAIQLHGNESPDLIEQLHPTPVIKAIHTGADELKKWKSAIASGKLPNLRGLLLETPDTGGAHGGTGVANDWDAIERLRADGHFDLPIPIILAGGLTPENVGDIVRRFAPYAVDVSSGIEGGGKREKSAEKIEAFIKAAHKADHDLAHAKKHS